MESIFNSIQLYCQRLTCLALFTPSFMSYFALYHELDNGYYLQAIIGLVPYVYAGILLWLLFIFWLINIIVISRLIKSFGGHFEQQIVNNPRATSKMIEEYRLLWVEVSLLIQQLGSVFAINMGIQLFVQIFNLIMSLYIWIFYPIDVPKVKLDALAIHILYVLAAVTLILSYCNSGYIIQELCKGSVTSKLLSADSQSRHKSSRTKILGASMTHLVVLIQFRLATEDSLYINKRPAEAKVDETGALYSTS